jgi:hypothetical protein
MDVLRLNASSYLPEMLIEDYSSMIWTERFLGNGEFSMKTPFVTKILPLLPEGQLISLRDSLEVMIVESQSIDVDSNGDKELTLTGRTIETFSENRVTRMAVYGELLKMAQLYKTSEFAAFLIWNYLVNATTEDPLGAVWTKDALSAIPNLIVTNSVATAETAKQWFLDKGEVYSQLVDLLGLGILGIRNIRPANTTANVVSVDVTRTGTRGTMTKTSTPNLSQLRIDLYNGVDRTRQNNITPVIFHYDSGHIDSPKYLWSIKDYKTVATVSSSIGNQDIWLSTGGLTPPGSNPGGLSRRNLFVDGGDQGDQLLADFQASIIQQALIELTKHNNAILFDGAISAVSPYIYNTHYSLGDKVTLMAEYGFESPMMVAEYVRTEDHDGDRGYPTLILAS